MKLGSILMFSLHIRLSKLIVYTVALSYVSTKRVILIQFYIVHIILNCWIILQIIHM